MKHKTSRVSSVLPRTSVTPLTEGLAKPNVQIVTLAGQTFEIPMRGKLRNWKSISDADIIAYTRVYCAEKRIAKSGELQKGPNKDQGLHAALSKRKTSAGKSFIDQVFERKDFEEVTLQGQIFKIPLNRKQQKNWAGMSNGKIVEYAKAYIAEKRIIKPIELQRGPNKNNELYTQLRLRKLLDQIFERKDFNEVFLQGKIFKIPLDGHGNRNWAKLNNDEILDYAKAYCNEKRITKSSELEKGENTDYGLYLALIRKKTPDGKSLLDQVFERKDFNEVLLQGKIFKIPLDGHGNRNWSAMTNDEIVDYAKAYYEEKGIARNIKLEKPDKGLYTVLIRRKTPDGKSLLDQVFERKTFEEVKLQGRIFKIPLDNKQGRNWSKMSDAEIIAFAKAYCKEKGITKSYELQKGPNKDNCLSSILYKRKLMDKVFSSIKAEQEAQQLETLASALETFGGSGK